MKTRQVGLAFLTVFTFCQAALAQEMFNEYAVHPDVWRPAAPLTPGVDSGGDLNLSIPILTIPGRGGLDYPVSFGYRSSIQAERESSWIGLGWSFDPGSITRDVQISYDDYNGNHQLWTADYAKTATEIEVQPDVYYVSLPGQSFSMSKSFESVQSNIVDEPPRVSGSDGFYFSDWKPWLVSTSKGLIGVAPPPNGSGYGTSTGYWDALNTTQHTGFDYSRFTLTDENGTRYVFKKPTVTSMRTRLGEASDPETNADVDRLDYFVNTWRLVAILGPNYTEGDIPCPNNTSVGGCSEYGDWIRLYYDDVQSFNRSATTAPEGLLQHTYLRGIETPTHYAIFDLSSKTPEIHSGNCRLGSGLNDPQCDDYYKKIDSISLKAKSSNQLVKKVVLETDNSHLATGNAATHEMGDRLKLKQIRFIGADNSSELPGYVFDYYGNLNCPDGTDRGLFGYCPGNAAWAWSLKSILHPTNVEDVIFYQNDEVAIDADLDYYVANHFAPSNTHTCEALFASEIQGSSYGGARVDKIATSDLTEGPDIKRERSYDYNMPGGTSGGRVSGVPRRHFTLEAREFFRSNSRSNERVVYPYIKEETKARNESGSLEITRTKETNYTTDLTPGISPVKTILRRLVHGGTPGDNYFLLGGFLVRDNGDQRWGMVESETIDDGFTTTTTTAYDLTVKKLSKAFEIPSRFTGCANDNKSYVRWYPADRVEHISTSVSYPGGGTVSHSKSYEYNTIGLPKTVTTSHPNSIGQLSTVEEFKYQYEVNYSDLTSDKIYDRNILRPVYKSDIRKLGGDFFRSTVEVWRPCDSAGTYCYQVDREPGEFTPIPWVSQAVYQFDAPTPSGARPFFNRSDPSPNWVKVMENTKYDAYGNVLKSKDGNGGEKEFIYPPAYQHALLTRVESSPKAGLRFGIDLAYDSRRRLNKITDPNGRTAEFDYDVFGRLEQTKKEGIDISTYDYFLSREVGGSNRIETKMRYSNSPVKWGYAKEYINGTGATIQSSFLTEGEGWVHSSSIVNGIDQVLKSVKPFSTTYPGEQLDPIGSAETEYNGADNPFVESLYDRTLPIQIFNPSVDGTRTSVAMSYFADKPKNAQGQVLAGLNAVYAAVESVDENDNIHQSFSDTRGLEVLRQTLDPTGLVVNFSTGFIHDEMGQLIETRPPNFYSLPSGTTQNDWKTLYRYNTRGNLRSKDTPDIDGAYVYKYDRRNNLRFTLDPNGTVSYVKYDLFSRPIETGVVNANFSTADPNDLTWPTSSTSEVRIFTYDTYGGGMQSPAGVNNNNGKGKLTRVQVGNQETQYYYDNFGNVHQIYQKLPDLSGGKLITYTHDLLGQVTKIEFDGREGEGFALTYRYDGAGRLQDVHSSVNGATPRQEADFSYRATGQAEQVDLGTAQQVDYAYHIRDWITGINNDDFSTVIGLGTDQFKMSLGYDDVGIETGDTATAQKNGNISWVAWKTPIGINAPDQDGAYRFQYDSINRLLSAEYLGTDGDYDVGNISYDASGNILTLNRDAVLAQQPPGGGGQSYSGNLHSLSNSFAGANNRITNVGTGDTFTYDANGNVTHDWRGLDYPTYSHMNQPLRIQKTGYSADYVYNAENLRVYVSENGGQDKRHYVRGADGSVLAVYEDGELKHWNILAGGSVIGRVEPASSN